MRIDEITDMYGDEITGDIEDHPDYTSLDDIFDGTILQSLVRPHFNKKVRISDPEGSEMKKLSLMHEVLHNKHLDEISNHWNDYYKMADVAGDIEKEYEQVENKYQSAFDPIFDPDNEVPDANSIDIKALESFLEEVHEVIMPYFEG